jgi:hypothetical protein
VKLDVLVNGRHGPPLDASSWRSDAPAILDVSDLIRPGDNTVAIQYGGTFTAASTQVLADYYIPWIDASGNEATRPGNSDALRLAVKFDKTEGRAGDEMRCSVDAERIGSRGWGMMIAEIGLPPGANVDRRVALLPG